MKMRMSATVLTADGGHTAWAIPPSWEKSPESGMAKVAPLMFMTMGQVNGIAQVVQGRMIQLWSQRG